MNLNKNKNNNYKTAIVIFLLIFFVVPFCHSEKVIRWATQNEMQRTEYSDIFYSLTLSYSYEIEDIKSQFGLKNFLESQRSFLLKIKESPMIFEEDASDFDIPIDKTIEENKQKQKQEQKPKQDEGQEQEDEKMKIPEKDISKSKTSKETNQTIVTPENEKIKEEQEWETTEMNIAPRIKPKFDILIIGDSFMAPYGGLGTVLERELLSYKDLKVVRDGKVSSGLSRPDYFNWDKRTRELVSQHKPNIAIVFFGSNDGQSLKTPERSIAYYGTNRWDQEYSRRVSNILNIFEDNDIAVFWIGVPIMKSINLSKKMLNINSVYKQTIQDYENAMFIPTWTLLTDNYGNYSDYLLNKNGKYQKARTADGVHLQYFGGAIITNRVIDAMKETMQLEKRF